MKRKKETPEWPGVYEAPKVFHIETAFQQALGVTMCSTGMNASGGAGSCSTGWYATGAGQPNSCSNGGKAMEGPGHGSSPCGHGWDPSA